MNHYLPKLVATATPPGNAAKTRRRKAGLPRDLRRSRWPRAAVYIYMCVCIYIYVYLSLSLYIYIYMCIISMSISIAVAISLSICTTEGRASARPARQLRRGRIPFEHARSAPGHNIIQYDKIWFNMCIIVPYMIIVILQYLISITQYNTIWYNML